MTARIYTYLTVTMRVTEGKSLSRLASLIRDNEPRLMLVDINEELRRVVIRAPITELPFVRKLVAEYASTCSYEVKATLRRRITAKELRSIGARVSPGKPGVLLFYVACNERYAVYGEVKGREVLLKLCRKGSMIDPSALPPGLCAFNIGELDISDAVEEGNKCFGKLVELLERAEGVGNA